MSNLDEEPDPSFNCVLFVTWLPACPTGRLFHAA
jgi:hypothetical protein